MHPSPAISPRNPNPKPAEDFCLEYADARGRMRRGLLEVMWPARFDEVMPVRDLSSYKRQRNFTGR
ncbi:hypothetical protein GCM10009664_09010 [Kitasatospora gansuensis]